MAAASIRLAECSYTPSSSGAMRLKAQDALSHLVNLEPRDLCNEAIVEKCRATRDLRSCGRIVQHVLVSCGHASLCAECCQRCDVCPICRLPIERSEPAMRLRLYEECLEAGLISYRDDELRDRDGHISVDVQRLWSFFDIALENSLVSLITHYVSDVCMDDDAVSSNAVVSMLLDGTVVKEWCEKTFMQILRSLRDIYSSGTKQIQNKVGSLDKLSIKFVGLSHVLECLEAPSDTACAPVLELQQLIEGVTRAFQHLDAMRWCARYSFLEVIPSSHSTINSWRSAVRARKTAANNRAWPEHTKGVSDASFQTTTLFIEDAMSNIGYGKGQSDDILSMFELGSLKLATVTPSAAFRRREVSGTQAAMHGSAAMYPPESVHAAVDLIFLDASADLILAKKAVFLYYLFDRQWPDLDGEWKLVLDDYMQTFDIPRHVMLESLLFFLLDDSSEIALEKACNILPEVVTFTLHPKVSRVFLERQKPDAALSALRCSGQDNWLSFSRFVREADIPPLSDAVTAVRVRIECGLLTEAYLYQRSYALKLKEQSQEDRAAGNTKDVRNWSAEIDLLVSELCWLCIRKRLVDKLIELPWQAAEERILLRCLLEHASQDPCSTSGNLMVVYYVMRCRNREAFLVHKRLCALEKVFLEQCIDEGKRAHVRTACAQRTVLVEKAVELLPKVLQEQLQSGAIEDLLPLSAEVSDPQGKAAALSEKLQGPDLRPHLHSHGKGESLLLPHRMLPDSPNRSGWEDFRQPSILHGRPFKATPGRSSVFPQKDHTSFPSQKENGEGFSPILGRRLIYNADEDSTPLMRKSNLSSSLQVDHQRDKQTNYFTDAESELPANINLLSRNLQGQINSSIRQTEPSGTAELRSHKESNGTERMQNGVRSSPGNVASTFINSYSSDIFNSQLENGKEQQISFVNRMEPASSYKPRRHMLHASPNGKRKAYDQLELCQPDLAPELDRDITGSLFNENGFKQYGKELQKGELSETESSINASGKGGLRWRAEEDGMELASPSVPRNKSLSASKRGSRLLRNHAL